jgi:hypothetical protein
MTKKTRYFMAGSAAIVAAGVSVGLVAFYTGGFQALSASTGPTELAFVPADASVVAYADVRSIMDSELRQRLREAMPVPEDGQQEFQQQTGIDIERDVDYVIAAMTPTSEGRPSGLVVARGRFNDVQLEGLAREHGGSVEEYRGKRLVTVNHADGDTQPAEPAEPEVNGEIQHLRRAPAMTLAFLEPGLVAVGESAAVKHAIDAQMSAQSITSNDEMMQLVSDIERTNNAWAVGRFDTFASTTKLPEQVSNQMKTVKWFAAAGHINGGVDGLLRAEARDDQSAENLRDVVRGVLALGRLQAQNDTRLAAVAQSLQLSGTGRTVELTFSIPAEIVALLPHAQAVQ